MGLFSFIKSAGEKLGLGGGDDAPDADVLKKEVKKHGLDMDGLDVAVDGDTVKVSGKAASQEVKEKIVLALGNVTGVAKVEEDITTEADAEQATFYTVQSGDTLSKIAKQHYGDANKYMGIFEANKPMLSHPDKIYPGQVLRIPPAA
ncbi:MAG: peptidoglycan-binding protein LysM [Rhodospirillales bacterium]|nr:peptidoglycan-binding protein LysM [Rhodospirillales bacterium]